MLYLLKELSEVSCMVIKYGDDHWLVLLFRYLEGACQWDGKGRMGIVSVHTLHFQNELSWCFLEIDNKKVDIKIIRNYIDETIEQLSLEIGRFGSNQAGTRVENDFSS